MMIAGSRATFFLDDHGSRLSGPLAVIEEVFVFIVRFRIVYERK